MKKDKTSKCFKAKVTPLRMPVIMASLWVSSIAVADTRSAEIDVQQPAADVQVQQSAPSVSVESRKPQVEVRTDEPQVSIEQSKPEIQIDQPEPEVSIQQAEPKIIVNTAEPKVKVIEEEPEVEVVKAEPEINIVRHNAEGDAKLSEEQRQAKSSLMSKSLSDIEGQELYSANGKKLGEISDVVLRKSDSKLGFIVPVGGLLGIGTTDIFVPAGETELSGDRLQWSQATSADKLDKRDGVDRDNFESVSSDYETLDDAYDASLVSQ